MAATLNQPLSLSPSLSPSPSHPLPHTHTNARARVRARAHTYQDKGILVYGGDKGVRSIEDVIKVALE